jgi:hypothetical protein
VLSLPYVVVGQIENVFSRRLFGYYLMAVRFSRPSHFGELAILDPVVLTGEFLCGATGFIVWSVTHYEQLIVTKILTKNRFNCEAEQLTMTMRGY